MTKERYINKPYLTDCMAEPKLCNQNILISKSYELGHGSGFSLNPCPSSSKVIQGGELNKVQSSKAPIHVFNLQLIHDFTTKLLYCSGFIGKKEAE